MVERTEYTVRFTRMVKSYAPIVNGLTELLGIDKPDNQPTYVFCKETGKLLKCDEFYVKKYHQDIDPKLLDQKSFRHINKKIWDEKVRNQRKGLGWKSDYELQNPPATIEKFIDDEVKK